MMATVVELPTKGVEFETVPWTVKVSGLIKTIVPVDEDVEPPEYVPVTE